MSEFVRLVWQGPYCLLDSSRVDGRPGGHGVYLCTVRLGDGVFYPIDVGEGDLRGRLSTPKGRLLAMQDYVSDPESLQRGESAVPGVLATVLRRPNSGRMLGKYGSLEGFKVEESPAPVYSSQVH